MVFGTDEYLAADGMPPDERNKFLHGLYKRQLEVLCGFRYVHSFEMINRQGHNVYSLFYGTRSIDGLRVMKDAMWAADPIGGIRFSDRLAGQPVLFGGEPDFRPLQRAIPQRFAGEEVSVEEVEHYVLTETPYKASHYKKQVLKPLEAAGDLTVLTPRARRFTYPAGTRMRFS